MKGNSTDFQLLCEFSTFCKQKHLISEAIALFEGLKEAASDKNILNYFLLQNYIWQSQRLLIQHKNPSAVKARATALIEEVLDTSFGDTCMHQLSSALSPDVANVQSKILLMDTGWENIGFIEHQDAKAHKSFLTKIGISLQENNEVKFYQSIPALYPHIQEEIPPTADIRISEDSRISLLTMEKAPGVVSKREQFQELIELHIRHIQKCTYDPVRSPAFIGKFEIGYNHLCQGRSFNHIHRKEGLIEIKKWVKKALRQAAYDVKIKKAVKTLGKRLKKSNYTR